MNEVDYNVCFQARDDWGPYYTIENCEIRKDQMSSDILDGPLNVPFFELLRNIKGSEVELMYVDGFCNRIETGNTL
jgi:hypothetical protein